MVKVVNKSSEEFGEVVDPNLKIPIYINDYIKSNIGVYCRKTNSVDYKLVINSFINMERYDKYIDELINTVKKQLSESKDELKRTQVVYRFNCTDEDTERMSLVLFLFNIVMWRPYIHFKIKITKKDIFQPETFYNTKYMDYFDRFSESHRDKFTMSEFSEVLYHIQIHMNRIAVEIGPLFGNSISIYDMVKMAKRNAEIDAILNTEVDLENFKVREVEEFLISQTERMFQILLAEDDRNNPLKPLIRARTGVNRHQVSESMIGIGFKPDLDGTTIPITSNTSLMGNGLDSPEVIYSDAKGKNICPF